MIPLISYILKYMLAMFLGGIALIVLATFAILYWDYEYIEIGNKIIEKTTQ